MSKYRIVLASASPRRRELLSQIGLAFEVCPSKKEEKVTGKDPAGVVEELSLQKAQDIYERLTGENRAPQDAAAAACLPPVLVIGADTIVAFEGQIMGKPKDREEACRMLLRLQGQKHQVYTGVTLIWQENGSVPGGYLTFSECTDVYFYPMENTEIEAYVDTGDPMDKAGAYGIQGRCAAHIKGIVGDYNNVVGLPAGRLYQEMHRRNLL